MGRRSGPVVLVGVLVTTACGAAAPSAVPVEPGSLVGVWTVGTPFDTPEQPFVSFRQDNTWSSSDGCTRSFGTWRVDAGNLLRTEGGLEERPACDGLDLPGLVVGARTVALDPADDSVVLMDESDEEHTVLTRATADVGPEGFPIGYWVEEASPVAPFLAVRNDRTFSGSDGCTSLRGTWTVDARGDLQLIHGPLPTVTCPDGDPWLRTAVAAVVRGDRMTLQDEDGNDVGALDAARVTATGGGS